MSVTRALMIERVLSFGVMKSVWAADSSRSEMQLRAKLSLRPVWYASLRPGVCCIFCHFMNTALLQ